MILGTGLHRCSRPTRARDRRTGQCFTVHPDQHLEISPALAGRIEARGMARAAQKGQGDPFRFLRREALRRQIRQGGQAIETLRALQETARLLNRPNLPEAPQGMALHAASRGGPGGDFFRAGMAGRRLFLLLGDAAGNGIEATMIGSHYAAALQDFLKSATGPPREALAQAARQALAWTAAQEFLPPATALLGFLENQIFTWLLLGHPAPACAGPEGPGKTTPAALPGLGMGPCAPLPEHCQETPLQKPGQGLIAATDGAGDPLPALRALPPGKKGTGPAEQAVRICRAVLRPRPLEKPGQDRSAAVLLYGA